MKIWKNKFLKQMIIVMTLICIVFGVIAPSTVYATKSRDNIIWNIVQKPFRSVGSLIGIQTNLNGEHDWIGLDNIPGNIVKELISVLVAIGDVGESVMQATMLGNWNFMFSTLVRNKNDNLDYDKSWLYADETDVSALENGETSERGSVLVAASSKGLSNGFFRSHWKVPNMLYSPENIFSNKIAALDANYINPHEYTAVDNSAESQNEAQSFAKQIRPTIATWYIAFRDISIVGLLSVLVYIGIRILIGTVSEKAKYKERLFDWAVALGMIFFMHFIMAGIMMASEKITNLFSNSFNSNIIITVDDGTIFRTSLMGYLRFAAQSDSWIEALGYGSMYLIVVGTTMRFTYIYMKRALYLAFFTMIAPLVALTYPIDKAGDGKAQAFNIWIKEYFTNAMLQPIHLILYTAFVGSAMTIVVQNPIYGIVVLLFMSTAEKWVKKMFKMDQGALTSSSIGDVALLGTMFGMGKNIVGGVAKTAGLVGLTAFTSKSGGEVLTKLGQRAVATGVQRITSGTTEGNAGGDGEGDGRLEDLVGNAMNGGSSSDGSNASGSGSGSADGSEEDVDSDEKRLKSIKAKNIYINTINMVDQMGEKSDINIEEQHNENSQGNNGQENNNQGNKNTHGLGNSERVIETTVNNAQEIAGEIRQSNPTVTEQPVPSDVGQAELSEIGDNSLLNGTNLEDITAGEENNSARNNSINERLNSGRNVDEQDEEDNSMRSGSNNRRLNSENNTGSQANEQEDNSQAGKYFAKELQSKLISKITDKDPKDQLIDMAIKGVAGSIGSVAGVSGGAFAAALTGDNKAVLAGAMGGANVLSGMANTVLSTQDTLFNNNVKVLVKAGITDENIIRNVAKSAMPSVDPRNPHKAWSEAKMIQVAKLASAKEYKELEAHPEKQNEIKGTLGRMGVQSSKLDRAIKDIIAAQKNSTSDDEEKLTKEEKAAVKAFEKWV